MIRVLRDAKEGGLCRYIGPTENSFTAVARVIRDVDVDMCLPTRSYDILRRGARLEVFPIARARNVTVVLGGIFYAGRVASTDPGWLTPGPDWLTPELRDGMERLYAVSRESGLTPVKLMIRYLLADRDFTTVLVGAANPAEIEESVAAAEKGPLPKDLHQQLEQLGIS